MTGAIAFVVMVRLIVQGVALVLSYPIDVLGKWLPNTEGIIFPRFELVKSWLMDHALTRLPEWAEHTGGGTILLKTNVGSDRLDAVVDRIPDAVINTWLQFGIATMVVFLVGWGMLILVALPLAARMVLYLTLAAVGRVFAYDWSSLLEPRATPSFDPVEQIFQLIDAIPEIAYLAATLSIILIISIGVTWLAILLLLPGLTLHEMGHYAAIKRAGGSVDSYGLLLYGPFLNGAFVRPGDDVNDLHVQHHFEILSVGVVNSLIWGAAVLSCGLMLSGEPLTVFYALYAQDYGIFVSQPVSSILLVVGAIEMANGFLNAIPIGPVDGGQFIQTAEKEWWGFDDTDGFGEKVRRVMKR